MPQQNIGAREVVDDPNAHVPRSALVLHQPTGIRAPASQDVSGIGSEDAQLANALGGIDKLVADQFEENKSKWVTQGKMDYLSGKTEADIEKTGNRFTSQGYQTLKAADAVNTWYTQQSIDIDQTHKQMDPAAYSDYIKKQSSTLLDSMTNPDAKAVATAALESHAPKLVQSQMVKNNEFNRGERINSFSTLLGSTAQTSATASQQQPGQQLPLSPVPVAAPITVSAKDRDTGIRTLLGEAANEGSDGMAAVAHVLRNRAGDGRWPSTIGEVALQPKQFSAWNIGAGGNSLVTKYNAGDAPYDKAGEVFDAVMSGRHVDPTGGATHYYSPAGMAALVKEGSQTNVIPKWLASESTAANGTVTIGGHVFTGRANGAPLDITRQADRIDTSTNVANGTSADLNAVPGTEGVKVAPIKGQGPNEVQEMIFGYAGLNDQDKATAVADQMRRDLAAGNDKLFRDGGGIGTLQKLKAKPSEIDEVIKAKDAFDKKRQNAFSTEDTAFDNDIMTRAKKGETLTSLTADIDKRYSSGLLSDERARSLASRAADVFRTEQKSANSVYGNSDFLNEVGQVYQRIKTGTDIATATEQAKAVAKKYGADPEDTKRLLGHIYELDQGAKDKLRAEAKTAAATAKEQADSKDEVNRAIAQGYGADKLNGTKITIKNDRGNDEDISQQQYAVSVIKDRWSAHYADLVNKGKMDPAKAKAELVQNTYLELQKHDIVDEKEQRAWTAAMTGNILDPKTSTGLRDETVKAYDAWLTLKNTPNISPAYLSKFVNDSDARSLLETAFKLDSGELDKTQSLLKAHEILNDKNRDPKDVLAKDTLWRSKLQTNLHDVLDEKANPGFWNSVTGSYDAGDRDRIQSQKNISTNYIVRGAEAYHLQNPNEDAEVSLVKAQQDFAANATHIMGNVVIGRPGLELHKVMGVSAFGPTAANEAVTEYVRKYGDQLWGKNYTGSGPVTEKSRAEGGEGVIHAIGRNILEGGGSVARMNAAKDVPVAITYNAELGTIAIDLYKDTSKNQTLGDPKIINVRDIGAAYVKEKTTPSTWDKAWAGMFKSTVGAIKSGVEAVRPPQAKKMSNLGAYTGNIDTEDLPETYNEDRRVGDLDKGMSASTKFNPAHDKNHADEQDVLDAQARMEAFI